MNKVANKETIKAPKLIDLINEDAVLELNNQDSLNFLLNQSPRPEWIKQHPYIKKEIVNERGQTQKIPYEYVPIDKVEWLLKRIFKRYRIEIKSQGQSFNGVYVTVRVWYFNPVFKDWDYHDGIGAIHLQVKSGSSPSQLENINNGALSMAYPLAKTLAIKDACDMFGDLFGANINRRDTATYHLDADLNAKASKQKVNDKDFEQLITNLKDGSISLEKVQELYDLTMEQMKEVLKVSGVLNGK